MNRRTALALAATLICASLASAQSAQIGVMTAAAGNDSGAFPGDGGPATNARVTNPAGVAVDVNGNLYIAASGNSLIRKVDANTGIITTVAGGGTGGDGGLATAAQLSNPCGVTIDSFANIYISETCVVASGGGGGGTGNANISRIRRIDGTTGIITTIAGTNSSGFAGDGGPATAALLNTPGGMALDSAGNLFIADAGNHRIRRIKAGSGIISTVAGNGIAAYAGDGGLATTASLNTPAGVAVDFNGNLYIADTMNNVIRRVDAVTGIITTVAGTGTGGFNGDGIPATAATLLQPASVAFSGGNVVFADLGNNRVRAIDNAGLIWTLAGTGSPNASGGQIGDNGQASLAILSHPMGLAALPVGSLFISELTGNRVREDNLPTSTTATAVTVSSPANNIGAGQPVTLTATLTAANGQVSNVGGVYFFDGLTSPVIIGSAAIVNGAASITLSSLSTGVHNISAGYVGNFNFGGSFSPNFRLTVGLPSSTVSLSANPSPALANQSVTLTATVSPSSATGAVSFYNGSTQLGSANLSGGVATLSVPGFAAGTYSLTAQYGGDSTHSSSVSPAVSLTVQATSAVMLTSSMNPAPAGQSVTFTAAITPATATGAVQFSDNGSQIGSVAILSGAASFSTSSLASGQHSITASYSGDATDTSATSALTQTINAKTATTTTVASYPNPAPVGSSVIFTATVSPATATGTVQFLEGATVLGTGTLTNGSTTFTTSSLAIGSHSITAIYNGDASNTGSTSAAITESIQGPTTVTLTSNQNPVSVGAPVILTATVSPATATGTVQFLDGTTVIGTGTLASGSASFTTTTLAQGTHAITAFYAGDATDSSSTSAPLAEAVKLATGLSLVSSLNPSVVGQTVTFTANVNPAATGTMQFLDGSTVLSTVSVASGVAAYSTSSLTQGSHAIGVIYSGNADYMSSQSGAIAQTVNAKTTTTTAVASTSNPAFVGAAVTFTATVTPATATGTMQFLDGAATLGTATIANGSASFTTSSLTAGAHSITAVYSGDAVDVGSTSGVLTETINAKTTTTTLTSTSNPALVTAAVTFTATVSPSSATGSVQFLDGATVLGTATLSNGTASFTTSSLAQGTHSITATYAGDAADASSTSVALSQVIKASASMTAGVSPSPAVLGQSVHITATMNSAATGTVQFTDGATLLATVPVSAGTASFSTTSLALGSHTLGVAYSGDATYMNASTTFPETVIAASTVVLSSTMNSSVVGQSVTFTASVSPSTATGTVQFYDAGTLIGTASLAGGSASIATAALAKGSHAISATYAGDASDASATSAALNQIVKAIATVALTSSVNPSTAGQSVTFTATVTPSAATGTIQFLDGSTILATVNVTSGSAAFSTSSLTTGAHSITVSYSGDTLDTAAASPAVTQTVNAAVPSAPSSLSATAAGSSQINLTWTASTTSGVTYDVYGSTTSGFTPSASNRLASGIASTAYSATGLNVSTAYYFRVTAVNAGGESAATNQASATTAGGFACHVTYSVTNQWNTGFGSAISIQNTGTTKINSWTLTWTWPGNQAITQSWNATYHQSGPNVTLTNESYNKQINAGATVTGIGFNASYSGSNLAPTAFYVNGTLCH